LYILYFLIILISRAGSPFTRLAYFLTQPPRWHFQRRFLSRSSLRLMAETGLTVKKEDNFPEWYTQVIQKSELIEYYDVSGCYILRPAAYFMWEQMQEWFNGELKKLGVKNSYFPLFVTRHALETEATHVEDFSPEVAWVTKYGESDLQEPIAIRPTSETIMYPAFSKWLRSHRDLPLKLNQWTSVVRWEFKQPTPFIRTREFLWQEGHTAHLTKEEAADLVLEILERYKTIYQDFLCVPVIPGIKSEKEKFAGAFMTTTVEAFIASNGRAIQGATSHHLGQNFSKMFNIEVEDDEGKKRTVHQTSWAYTTRSLGVMIMVHGDDKGLVLPPRVAEIQVVLVPIPKSKEEKDVPAKRCHEIAAGLVEKGVRAFVDDRYYKPGWKYNYWELRGVPIRIEVGQNDIENGTCRLVRRDNREKIDIPYTMANSRVPSLLDQIQKDMLQRATEERDANIVKVTKWEDVIPALNRRKMILAPWCELKESEEAIKAATKETEKTVVTEEGAGAPALSGSMKTLCIPMMQPPMPEGTMCFHMPNLPAKRWCLFGRSY